MDRVGTACRVLLLGAILATGSRASENGNPKIDPDAAARETLALVRKSVFDSMPRDRPGTLPFTAAQAAAFVGREDLYALRSSATLPACAAQSADPVAEIVTRARKTNIVIINENHAAPLDRHFIGLVLGALRREGYTIYAGETFSMYESLDHQGALGFDGWYSNEPIFGRLLNLARTLGYSLVPYEQTGDQEVALSTARPTLNAHDLREENETANLMATVFTRTPDAKVVIHVGHSHVHERKPGWSSDSSVWMAEKLKAATGRDPLTISQVDCKSAGSADVVSPVRMSADGDSPVDLFVGHPPLVFKNGRPAWREAVGDKFAEVPPQFLNLEERVIVEARPVAAGVSVVPTDRLLLFPGEHLPLLLPPGRYRIDGYVDTGPLPGPFAVVEVK